MIENLKNFRVNWVDGMKISKDHFIEIQNYIQEVGRDVTSFNLNERNYGLLPSNNKGTILEVTLNAHNSVSISIQKLSAITPNGSRVEINELTPKIEKSITLDETNVRGINEGFIVLSVDPNNDNTFGKANLDEVPPRLPSLNSAFLFSVIDKDEIVNSGISAYHLPIAKIKSVDGVLEIERKYIPPCLTVGSDYRLLEFSNYVESFLNKIEDNSIRIVKKIRAERNRNSIADLIENFCGQLLTYLGSRIITIESHKLHNAPLTVINSIKSMARIIKNHIDTYSPKLKESLFIYFGEWIDLEGGDFEKLFTKTINLDYLHYDMFMSIEEISKFTETMNKLFDILTEIDYIGKKKDTGLFVNERQVTQSKSENKPSFLAD